MERTVSMKMGIREGIRACFIHAPAASVEAMKLPALNLQEPGEADLDYIHLFVTKKYDFIKHFPVLKKSLSSGGMFWVSWPKSKKLETDLSLPVVIELGYSFGLVESTCLSIDSTWSGLKFTHPKPGKVYQNSFGKLPG